MPRFLAVCLATTFVAGAASAQDICGLGEGQWIGGTESASDIASADSHREQMALVLSGNQHVSLFSLSAATDVRIEAAGRGAGDPTVAIFDENGTEVGGDDDSGGAGAARAELPLNAGSYCVTTSSYDGSPMTAFVRIGRVEQEALTAGLSSPDSDTPPISDVSCDDAPMIGTLDGIISATGAADDTRIWRFTLPFSTPLSITAENEAADPTILLTDASGEYIAENDDYDGLNSRIDVTTPLAAGDYCIEVDALSDSTQPMTLTVDVYDPEAALAALYDRGEAAPPLNGTVEITDLGVLQNRLRSDAPITVDATWYSFTVPEGGFLLLEAIAQGGSVDPWIALFDDRGRQVAVNDDYSDTLDSQITARIVPGDYMLAVKQVGDGAGFVRILAERFVPAP